MSEARITVGTRRRILIVEDNEINREILSSILEEEFDLLEAENGEEGIKILSENYQTLSLIILDVYMPVCNGFEFLEKTQQDPALSSVPVIVATGSNKQEDEVRCLHLGASDFVTKPYNPEVVLGRAHSIIKLKESVTALSIVEFDRLTNLYTMPAFYHHAQELLTNSAPGSFDLSVLNLQEFKLINSIYGEKKGDEVLSYVGSCYRKNAENCLMARQGDKFYSLSLASQRPTAEEGQRLIDAVREGAPVANLTLKIGLCTNVDSSLPVSFLCDRVLIAAASIKQDFSRQLAVYDEKLQKRLIDEQKMEGSFEAALKAGQFVPWFQPKVSTKTEKVVAAEALVRWIGEDGKMISPGAFVPLFERDGLICRLDEYIFRKVCEFQAERIRAGKNVVPISVNLSRNSIYQKDTAERYLQIVRETGVLQSLVPIELTESAAMEGAGVLSLTQQLCAAGFSLHMDDFGSGYSSLSSLTSIPFDVIKLDKSLVDQIGNEKGNTVIRHVIRIAQEMGMHTVAEGAESLEQVDFLKENGCDMIQGYYYSPPRDRRIFEEMLDRNSESLALNLDAEYKRICVNTQAEFDLDEHSMHLLERVSEGMEEGFFMYRATSDETLIFANLAAIHLFGCTDMQDFRQLTRNSFRGIVCPEEYERVEKSIFQQINESQDGKDAVEYHICRKDGTKLLICDEGHCVYTKMYGNIFYVFIWEKR